MTHGATPTGLQRRGRKARTRAMTLIETAMALAILALATAFAITQIFTYMERMRSKTVAEKMVEVSAGANAYLKSNYAALIDKAVLNGAPLVIPAGRTTATGAIPAGPASNLPSLQGGGFLASSFVDANAYGQHHAFLVRKTGATTLEAMVTTFGGQTIPDDRLAQIGNFVGNTGGYILNKNVKTADANKIVGAYGGYRSDLATWGASTSKPVAGHFQSTMAFQNGVLVTDYLYRNDIGIHEANTMNTSIDMNSNDIDQVQELTGVSGKNPGMTGDVVRVKGSLRTTIDVWSNQDVMADRDMIAGNDITAGGTVSAEKDVHAHQNVIADNNVVATNDLEVGRNATIDGDLDVGGSVEITKDLTANGDSDLAAVDLTRTVAVIPGRYEKGAGIKLADLLPRMVPQYSYLVKDGERVAKPSCGGDRTRARIMVHRQVESIKGYPQVRLVTTSSEGYITSVAQDVPNSFVNIADGILATTAATDVTWKVTWVGSLPADGATRQAIAQTYCYFG
jgi:type II secretory pathway pseudopilin PulG